MNCPSNETILAFMAKGCSKHEASVLELMIRVVADFKNVDEQFYANKVSEMLSAGHGYDECASWIKDQL